MTRKYSYVMWVHPLDALYWAREDCNADRDRGTRLISGLIAWRRRGRRRRDDGPRVRKGCCRGIAGIARRMAGRASTGSSRRGSAGVAEPPGCSGPSTTGSRPSPPPGRFSRPPGHTSRGTRLGPGTQVRHKTIYYTLYLAAMKNDEIYKLFVIPSTKLFFL